jgi:nickel-dependent lactate racemase
MLLFGDGSLPLPPQLAHAPRLERPTPQPQSDPARAVALALGHPVGRPPLSAWVRPGERVAIVVPDLTRTLHPAVLAEVAQTLLAAGARPFVRFANGTHRRLTPEEVARRVPAGLGLEAGDRDCDDPAAHTRLGSGAALDAAVAGADRVVTLGPVAFHYLAGFGGGAKLLAPGLADRATAEAVHRACLDAHHGRAAGARPGVFPHENPLHQRIRALTAAAPPVFSVVTLEAQGQLLGLFAGEPAAAHHAACMAWEGAFALPCMPHRAIVVSAGGAPYDRDFIQAHKSLESMVGGLAAGGALVWVARCEEGVPARARRWLDFATADALEAELRQRFDITGHTFLAQKRKAERHRILAVTAMDAGTCQALGMEKAASLEAAVAEVFAPGQTAVAPHGARFLLKTPSPLP